MSLPIIYRKWAQRVSASGQRVDWLPALLRFTLLLVLAVAAPGVAALALIASSRLRRAASVDLALLTRDITADSWWPLALVAMAAMGGLIGHHPFPPDDLARDLVAHFVDGDYRHMFWGSPLVPSYSLYRSFDWLAGWAWKLPNGWRALPFQLLPLATFIVVMAMALSRCLPDKRPDRRLWIAGLLLLTLAMPGVTTRFVQGRPEVDFAVWALSALILPGWLWTLVGLVLAPMYWIAPVYAAGALLLTTNGKNWRQRWCRKLAWGALSAISAALWWQISTHGHWLGGLSALHAALANRVGMVSEDGSIWALMSGTGVAVLALLVLRFRAHLSEALRHHADLDLYLTACIFLAPNMIRYTDILSPLAVLIVARAVGRDSHILSQRMACAGRILVFWACLFLLPGAFAGAKAPNPGFLSHVHPGDRILSPFSPNLYRAIYAAVPHGAVLAPAMEVGMTRKPLQHLAMKLSTGHW
ncbi:MAG: hypothetical protein L0H29_04675, partial [Sinobacteraceae bacterium]|nr:hypothetical protein [Nevskiaceae bacterium]